MHRTESEAGQDAAEERRIIIEKKREGKILYSEGRKS